MTRLWNWTPVSALLPTLIVTLVIVRAAKPYNMKVAEETERELSQMLAQYDALYSEEGRMDEESSIEVPSDYDSGTTKSASRKSTYETAWSPPLRGNHKGCPPRYEEIIGYCADSPIGNPLSFNLERCSSQCNLNPQCLGFSWDKDADGINRPFSCMLQHTECRFPTYSSRFGFCRKMVGKPKPLRPHPHHRIREGERPRPPLPPPASPFEVPTYDLPPIRISDEPNTEILRAYLSTYDQICDSDKNFKTTTVFTCAQYCLADSKCQAFSYDNQGHVCRFIGHCQQKQVFKKLYGSSGMPDILSLLNFILTRAGTAPALGMGTLVGTPNPLVPAFGSARIPAPAPSPLVGNMMSPIMSPMFQRSPKPSFPPIQGPYYYPKHPSRQHRYHSAPRHSSPVPLVDETDTLHDFDRYEGDCQGALLDNKVYEIDVYECAKKCQHLPTCAGFSVNLYVSSPRECYLRAEACTSPIPSSAWVFYRKAGFHPIEKKLPAGTSQDFVESSVEPSDSTLGESKTEKMYAFYDFLHNNLNRSQSSINGASSSGNYRYRTSHDQPMMARRALGSQTGAVSKSESRLTTPTRGTKPPVVIKKNEQEKILEYFTALSGNCRGHVLQQLSVTMTECAIKCIHTTKCLGFAYDKYEKKCFIKSNKCTKPEPSLNGVVYYQLRM